MFEVRSMASMAYSCEVMGEYGIRGSRLAKACFFDGNRQR